MSENVGDETSVTSYSLQLNLTENLEDDMPFKDIITTTSSTGGTNNNSGNNSNNMNDTTSNTNTAIGNIDNISTNTKSNILTFPLLTSLDILPSLIPMDQSKTAHLIEQQQDINKILDQSNNKNEKINKVKKRKLTDSNTSIKSNTVKDNQSDDGDGNGANNNGDDDNSKDEDYINNSTNKKQYHFTDQGTRTRSQDILFNNNTTTNTTPTTTATTTSATTTTNNTTNNNTNTTATTNNNTTTTTNIHDNEDIENDQDCISNLGSQIGSIHTTSRPYARTVIGDIAVDVPVPVIKLR